MSIDNQDLFPAPATRGTTAHGVGDEGDEEIKEKNTSPYADDHQRLSADDSYPPARSTTETSYRQPDPNDYFKQDAPSSLTYASASSRLGGNLNSNSYYDNYTSVGSHEHDEEYIGDTNGLNRSGTLQSANGGYEGGSSLRIVN